ncbi:hypothetical protein BS50DRAFT_627642 [Corynespora cassiicola Philippines]|uniref:SnoaL-like domain-containing protein n=1 Tax=Corynespora cassiicola Philippines TaxID=1448308 RepID=A0A2T2P9G6_CORCC|nr:hypothetical protein BS50DRAFT_627642 [Corynespora cassiicola Philippines]
MRFALLASALLAPVGILAAPTAGSIDGTSALALEQRQASPPRPEPCVRQTPEPCENITAARHAEFAQAFIYDQNITKAFEFIAEDYINHNPAAENGFDSAWNILSPFWGTQEITPFRHTFISPQGWVNYNTTGFGEVVDRFRWEGGCIAEHWDQGEQYPTQ